MMLYLLALGTSMERSVLRAVMVLWACEHTLEQKMSDLDKGDQTESAPPVGGPTPRYKACFPPHRYRGISRLSYLKGKISHSS